LRGAFRGHPAAAALLLLLPLIPPRTLPPAPRSLRGPRPPVVVVLAVAVVVAVVVAVAVAVVVAVG